MIVKINKIKNLDLVFTQYVQNAGFDYRKHRQKSVKPFQGVGS